MDACERESFLSAEDGALLRFCKQDFYIATGNGGQHRNKTRSAVRLTHESTGITVCAERSRASEENRHEALKKLRYRIALHVRCPAEPFVWHIPSQNNAAYVQFMARLLDVLCAQALSLKDAAAFLGQTTAQIAKVITADPELLQFFNALRAKENLPPLRTH